MDERIAEQLNEVGDDISLLRERLDEIDDTLLRVVRFLVRTCRACGGSGDRIISLLRPGDTVPCEACTPLRDTLASIAARE